MTARYKPPSVGETSFNCPHCGALAHQTWYRLGFSKFHQNAAPIAWTPERLETFLAERKSDGYDKERLESVKSTFESLTTGAVMLSETTYDSMQPVSNMWISECYNCNKLAVWIHQRLVYPFDTTAAPDPNQDLPDDILRDYREAASIVNTSPRGAAALLRLCIQKLCDALGQKGKGIDHAIANLVRAGLDSRMQKALDAVRVIGNSAVHPGHIDLRDDVAVAKQLFTLVNLVAEKMITVPKHVDEFYETLPQSARDRIAKRDKN